MLTSGWLETSFKSTKAEGGFTVRQTSRAVAKAGLSDPLAVYGCAKDHRI
jgi:hypothetical protein